MTSQEYRHLLSRLPIINPTLEDMIQLCPHLTREQVISAFSAGTAYVACPGLKVRGAFQIISLSAGWSEKVKVHRAGDPNVINGNKEHPPRLNGSYAGRIKDDCTYAYAKEAIAFSENNWGNELVEDTWSSVCQIILDDPTDLRTEGYGAGGPRTKAILCFGVNCDWNDLNNKRTKLHSEAIDDAIVILTLDAMVWHEIKGSRGGYTDFNCAHCGSGLGLSGCSGCGHNFKDNQFRTGWHTPLSKKMVACLLEAGHVFPINPEIAWKKEKEKGF